MSAHRSVTIPYRRIRMINFEDADTAYPLIAAYLEKPELTHTVEEIAVRSSRHTYIHSLHDPGANRQLFTVSGGEHASIRAYVDGLGMLTATTRRMVEALDWWRETGLTRSSQPAVKPATTSTYVDSHDGRLERDEELYDYYQGTAAALLLSLCPNISTLYLAGVRGGPLEEYLLRSNYGLIPRPGLQKLRHVQHYIEGIDYEPETYDELPLLDTFRYFHRLPQISSVRMDGVMNYEGSRDIFPPRTSAGIKKIHLENVEISHQMLATIVRIPTGLEELSVSIGGGLWDSNAWVPVFQIGVLGRSLEQHRETLRILDIDLGPCGWVGERDEERYEDVEDACMRDLRDDYFEMDNAVSDGPLRPRDVEWPTDHDGRIMEFGGFTSLTHLSINVHAIMGPVRDEIDYDARTVTMRLAANPPFRLLDALPPSLEYLCLYGYVKGEFPDVDEQMAELMENKAERLPNLREIRGVESVEHGVGEAGVDSDDPSTWWKRPEVNVEWLEA